MEIETRGCRAEELDALVRLANRVFRGERPGDMQAEYPLVFDPEHLEQLRIVPGEGGPIAHVGVCVRDASLLGASVRVASIGAVCTDPVHRGRGLASALMEDARRFARESGASLMLISGGRGLYHRLGYVTVGRFLRYQWSADDLQGFDAAGIGLTGCRAEELGELAALYQAEPVRFLRPILDWERLAAAPVLMNAPADLIAIRQGGRLVAYVGVQHPRADISGGQVIRIQEIAGSRSAVLAALSLLLERHAATTVTLTAQPGDAELTAQSCRHGWRPAGVPFPGTVGVIDPERLLDALTPLFSERHPQAAELRVAVNGDQVVFHLDGERYEVGAPGPIAALLFGGDTEEASALPPRHGRLGELLETLFPLPLLWYGYNYV